MAHGIALQADGTLAGIAGPGPSIYLEWSDFAEGETGYLLNRKTSAGDPFQPLIELPPDSINYTDTSVAYSTRYFYSLEALNADTSVVLTTYEIAAFQDPVSVDNWPEYMAVADRYLDWSLFLAGGQGVSHRVERSADLIEWSLSAGPQVGRLPTDTLADLPGQTALYRVAGSPYALPGKIGLTRVFEYPRTPSTGGQQIDVTLYGAAPKISGNDDSIGIIAALGIASPGDIVYLPEGRYEIRQPLVVPTGITLMGDGPDKTTIAVSVSNMDKAITVPPEASDIVLEGFAVEGFLDDDGNRENDLQYGVYIGSVRQGRNSFRIGLLDLRIERFAKHGVSIRDANHVLVKGCVIRNATDEGGGGFGYGIALNYPDNHDNWIVGNVIGPGIRHAVLLQYYAHNNLVEHCVAVANSEDAFDLHGEDEYSNELRFNLAYDGLRDGFGVGNTGSTHDKSGAHNWIHHNEVRGSLAGAEVIQGSTHVYLDHNYFHDNEYGIRVHDIGGAHVYIRSNRMEDNEHGIWAEEGDFLVVEDNVISGASQEVILIHTPVTSYKVTGNDLRNNTGSVVINSPDGIYTDNQE